jgi:hypothetical protein
MDISIPFENGDVFFSSIERMIKMGGIVYGKRFCGILPNQKTSIEIMIKWKALCMERDFVAFYQTKKLFVKKSIGYVEGEALWVRIKHCSCNRYSNSLTIQCANVIHLLPIP